MDSYIFKLPLVHGGHLKEVKEKIMAEGLVPQNMNTTDLDIITHREKCVFFRLASYWDIYGFGDFIICDPKLTVDLKTKYGIAPKKWTRD